MNMHKGIISVLLAAAMFAGSAGAVPIFAENNDTVQTRKYENLDRGLTAMNTDNGIYLSWRFFENEKKSKFYVYRDGEKIAEVDKSTNYLDKDGKTSSVYTVAPVSGDKTGEQCGGVKAFTSGSNYFDIPLDVPADITLTDGETYSYTAGDASCGDLDGDGEYELVLKWDANAKDNSQSGYTGNVLLDAYKMDGTKLWRIDLGKNIRGGAHYTQFMVFDLDGDGKAEVAAKTAPGSADGKGNFVNTKSSDPAVKAGDNSKVYLNDGGYILSGPEYYTVFAGNTGEAVDTISYPVLRGFDANNTMDNVWGDTYGNRGDRFLSGVAHLDGIKPSLILWRGYYGGKDVGPGRTGVAAVSFNGEKLSVDKYFDTYSKAENGYTQGNEQYIGQGNHSLVIGDMDGDGCDEVVSGSLCLDNDFSVKWCAGLGHGDAHHLADYDPTNESLEYFIVHEESPYGMSLINSATGEVLYHEDGSSDTGRGMMANVGAGGYYQMYSARNSTVIGAGNNKFEKSSFTGSMNFRIFWDGDLYDELLDGITVTDYQNGSMKTIFTADGCTSINGTKATPSLSADLFGDWREELVYPLADNSALRVFTTNISTNYRIPTLMHDDLYRSGVASENTAYNQPPHIGYYLSEDDFAAKVAELEIVSMPSKTEYKLMENIDFSDMVLKAKLDDGTESVVTDYILSGYNKNSAGTQTVEISYRGLSKYIDVVVSADMVIDNGVVKKYIGQEQSVIIPVLSDGTEVKIIAAGSFSGTAVKEITIPSGIETIEDGAFDDGVKLIVPKGSAAHIYAIENGLEFEISGNNMLDSYVDVSFSENSYNQYKGGTIFTQGSELQETTIDGVLYHVGGRGRGGDGCTGFGIKSDADDGYLEAAAGRFSNAGRNAIMTFNNAPTFENGLDYVFSADICFPTDTYNANIHLKISDGASVITEISKESLGVDYDKWYKYSLIYHDGIYTQIVSDTDGNIIYRENIVSDVMSIAKIEYVFSGTLNNGESTKVYLDNIKIYSSECVIGTIKFRVSGNYDKYIPNALIKIGGTEIVTDKYGMASADLLSDVYSLQVSAEDCEDYNKMISFNKNNTVYEIQLKQAYRKVEDIQCDAAAVELKRGCSEMLNASVIPKNASVKTLSYISSNPEVAFVSDDGRVTAVSAGEAVISVISDDNESIKKECNIKVTETEDLSKAAAVKISGGSDTVYKGEKSQPFNAVVYDFAGNVLPENAVWTSLTDGVSVENNIVTVSESCVSEKAVIRASSESDSTVYAEKEINIKEILSEQIMKITFDESDYDGMSMHIETTDSNAVKNILNTTFGVGTRTGGADTSTGIEVVLKGDKRYLRGFAGKFHTSDRNSYMTVNNAPVMQTGKSYIFTMDIMIEKEASQLKISDGTNTLNNSLITSADGLEEGKWYKLRIVYTNGNIIQKIISEDGTVVSRKEYTSSINSFSRFDFLASNTTAANGICIDNISYNTSEDIFGKLIVRVVSESGNPVAGAEVICGETSSVTDSDGCAYITAECGVYNVSVRAKGYSQNDFSAEVSNEGELYEVKLGLMDIKTSFFGDSAIIKANNESGTEMSVKVICAGYKNGELLRTYIRDIVLEKGMNTVLLMDMSGESDDMQVFIWSDFGNITPKAYKSSKGHL